MPFYRSYGYRTPSSSIWQQPSTTLSLKSACAKYNVTEAQCQKANIRCQWRSMYGNSYAVVVEDDVRDLKAMLVAKATNEKQEKLKGKLGEKGYEIRTVLEEASRPKDPFLAKD
ncbi:expressed unknown protein [Seminavis robusta]|uniref:Uncharacterized protein n=1 Tax=Seminavis robusta TaxID=568900 RepID=A0A9N8H161_9STRA|nr:expressed unknown protein [Seminavis robusta]|eukprot:Sro33_g021680.1 n/a (114) ;mRNA; r:135243-135584